VTFNGFDDVDCQPVDWIDDLVACHEGQVDDEVY
jgi:hypothetical protein